MSIATVTSCSTTSCSYNHDGCTAFAITVGGTAGKATCGTFVTLDARGGTTVAAGQVGACKRLECVHNEDLMCTADAISVAGDSADCLTYQIA